MVRHGFPDDPRCMAYDCIQRLIAIGAGRGSVRLLGQAGVDIYLKHDSNESVIFVQFLVNEVYLNKTKIKCFIINFILGWSNYGATR